MDDYISEQDVYLFHQGTNYYSDRLLGRVYIEWEGRRGFRFAVWPPNASAVSIKGDFNIRCLLKRIIEEKLWADFFVNITGNPSYKYEMTSKQDKKTELRTETASVDS